MNSRQSDREFIVSSYRLITTDYSLTVSPFSGCFFGHGGLLAAVPPHLHLLSVRGREEVHRC